MRERYDDEKVRLCTQVGWGMHYPGRGQSEQSQRAKALCALCEVKKSCLDIAMTTNEHYGVWGGMSEVERRQERKRRRLATEPTLLSQTV